MKYILTDEDRPQLPRMGGKAFNLAQLKNKVNIPKWFVVTPEAFREDDLAKNNKTKHYPYCSQDREAQQCVSRPDEQLRQKKSSDSASPHNDDHTPTHSTELITEAQIEIELALSKLGAGPFAVRSSAIEEDSKEYSFAGQFDSFLNVSRAMLFDKILAVKHSAHKATVNAYRRSQAHLKTPASVKIAVIVQNMLDADTAGVVFSRDPIENDKIAITATRGLADQLVSGKTVGDTYFLLRDGSLFKQILTESEPLLTSHQQQEVARLAMLAEAFFDCPQDVEWVFKASSLYLVQSRAITRFSSVADEDLIIWDNSNIVESYSGITLPLTFSFARTVYAEVYREFCLQLGVNKKTIAAHQAHFKNMLGLLEGQVYYNLLNWYRVLSLFPGFQLNRSFMEQMMGVKESLPQHLTEKIAKTKTGWCERLIERLRLAKMLVILIYDHLTIKIKVKKFYQRLDQTLLSHLKDNTGNIAKMNLTELSSHYNQLESQLLNAWDAPLINDFLCMIFYGLSLKLTKKWCGEEKGGTLHNDFMIGQGDIISAEPVQRIQEMAALIANDQITCQRLSQGILPDSHLYPALQAKIADYLAKFGDRCTAELKLESLTLEEDPLPLYQAIAHMAMRKTHAHLSTESNQHADPIHIIEQFLKDQPIKKLLCRYLIRIAKARVRDRENLRFERTRIFGRVRKIFLAIGKQLSEVNIIQNRRDIFYLEFQEVLGAIAGTSVTHDFQALIEQRKKDYQYYTENAFNLPNRLETHGAVIVALQQITQNKKIASTDLTKNDSQTLQGLPCCRGVVKAMVRLIHDPRQQALLPGEILVARYTDPGWIAHFSNAAGLLIERGSLLSHSAIVAREMGIPAIVAIPDVMSHLKTGDWVEMDGSKGTIVKVAHD